jgi:hypothetical protein
MLCFLLQHTPFSHLVILFTQILVVITFVNDEKFGLNDTDQRGEEYNGRQRVGSPEYVLSSPPFMGYLSVTLVQSVQSKSIKV